MNLIGAILEKQCSSQKPKQSKHPKKGKSMIWNSNVSFDGYQKKIDDWYKEKDFELCDPPISAQYALDLIFKTLVDDKEKYLYLTAIPETTEQTNSIMLELILKKYSRRYRKYKKKWLAERKG